MTKNNHYNPCFWTALWSAENFEKFKRNQNIGRARDQKVLVLSYRRPKILKLKTELVHVIKGFALIPATIKEHNDFFGKYKMIAIESDEDFEDQILIDMEPLFSLLEENACYSQMIEIVRKNEKISYEDKQYLAVFISYHKLRSPIFFINLYNESKTSVNPKLEMFQKFHQLLVDDSIADREVIPLLKKAWIYYKFNDIELPLPDNPIIKDGNIIWVILSPKNLIKIDLSINSIDVELKENLTDEEFNNLIHLIINNSYSEIISMNLEQLIHIQNLESFQLRKKLINS